MPVNICLKHHESLSENGVLMREHSDASSILEVYEDIIQCAQQKITWAERDHFIATAPHLSTSQ